MRVVCDSCGASYKIPDSKLTKEVNKATCRKCGHAIFIRRAGEEDAKSVSAAPAPVNEERTLITSAADLERQARARAGGSFDEAADQRPTTVSLDNGPPEATVPREPAPPASFAPAAAFPPPVASPFSPPPSAAFPQAVAPTPFAPPPPAPVAAPVATPAAPPAPFAPAAARPEPVRAAPISPSSEAPPAFARPPEPVAATPVAAANVAAAAVTAGHDPRTDLSMALVALFVTVLGVLVLSVASVLANPIVAGLGAFLSLLGTFVVAFILLTGGRGTKPASHVVSFVGGFFLSGAVGGALTGLIYAVGPTAPAVPVAAATPAAPAPVEAPPAAPAPAAPVDAAPPVDPATALADAPPTEPATPPAAEPVVTTPPPAATPAPTASTPPAPTASTPPASKPATTTTSTPPKQTASTSRPSSTSSKASSSDDAPVRIQPSSTSSSKPASSSSSGSSSSGSSSKSSTASTSSSSSTSGASTSSAAKSTGVSAVVIDTMIKSNKGVKSCFVTQRNETGDLPRGVKVKLTIQPSGKVSSAGIPSGEWAGSSFDDCLSGAVRSIQFPPFEGDPVTVTYPFSI